MEKINTELSKVVYDEPTFNDAVDYNDNDITTVSKCDKDFT
jgi:hypothetical protein